MAVFNHHSLPFASVVPARDSVPTFLRVALQARAIGFSLILVDELVDGKWFSIQLADGYSFGDWFRGAKLDGSLRDIVRAFLSIATRQSFFAAGDNAGDVDSIDVHLQNDEMPLPVLRAAVWHGSPLISFPTRAPWDATPIQIVVEKLLADSTIESAGAEIDNLHSLESVAVFGARMREVRAAALHSGRQLLEECGSLYAHIELCGRSKEQLADWTHSVTVLNQVKDTFFVLDSFARRWIAGEFPAYSHEAVIACGLQHQLSGESQSIKQSPYLCRQREFWLPSGEKAFFEYHVKLAGGFRVHFYPDEHARRLYIGYIGPHLPLE